MIIIKYLIDAIIFAQSVDSNQKIISIDDDFSIFESVKGPKALTVTNRLDFYEKIKITGHTVSIIDTLSLTDQALRIQELDISDTLSFSEEFSSYGRQEDIFTLNETLVYDKLTTLSDDLTFTETVKYRLGPNEIKHTFVIYSYVTYYIIPAVGNPRDIVLPQ